MSVNKAILVGRLGQDPNIKTFPNGGQIANFSVATENRWKDRETGEQKSVTTWHRCVCRGKLAELAERFLNKGSQVYIEGRTDHRTYTDPNSNEEKVSVEVVVNELRFLDSKQDKPNGNTQKQSNEPDYNSMPDEDLSF